MSGHGGGLRTGWTADPRVIISSTGSSWRPVPGGSSQVPIVGPGMFNLSISDLDEGAEASSAISVTTQSWEQWLIPQRVCSPSEGPQQAGEMGREEPSGIQQRQMQGPAPGEEQPQAPAQAGGDLLESGSVEKELRVLVGNKLSMSQQCALVATARDILECIRNSSASRLEDVILLLFLALCPVQGSSAQQRHEAPGVGPAEGYIGRLEIFVYEEGLKELGCLAWSRDDFVQVCEGRVAAG